MRPARGTVYRADGVAGGWTRSMALGSPRRALVSECHGQVECVAIAATFRDCGGTGAWRKKATVVRLDVVDDDECRRTCGWQNGAAGTLTVAPRLPFSGRQRDLSKVSYPTLSTTPHSHVQILS